LDEIWDRLGEICACIELYVRIDKVCCASAKSAGVVDGANLDEIFLEECRQSPTCVLMQVALKEFTFGVRHDEMLDDTFLCLSVVIQEEV
jgi:hypothetical protein